jgi:hypothetical protein
MYTVMWKANGIAHECRTLNYLTARVVLEAVSDYWRDEGIVVQIWSGAKVVSEEIS